MEKRFRILDYKEGEAPIFHRRPLNDTYTIEGEFLDELESGKSPFSAKDPNEAIAFSYHNWVSYGQLGPPYQIKTPKNSSILALFGGGTHDNVRKELFNHWKNKYEEIQVHEYFH
ncbi:hypothetical protein VNO77_30375 [Canavalia gladiata]|uniref:Uncharacterized protein n=1 Tax=Canavalia gladiata TaxID=3824 RepID=A0AAN9KQS6_CANGL